MGLARILHESMATSGISQNLMLEDGIRFYLSEFSLDPANISTDLTKSLVVA